MLEFVTGIPYYPEVGRKNSNLLLMEMCTNHMEQVLETEGGNPPLFNAKGQVIPNFLNKNSIK